MSGGLWPGAARAALSLSFDNLGEAAEVGAGARDPDGPLGGHPTATEAVPAILDLLAARRLTATFFVEGLNAEVYPELLARIDAQGHEVAYHAWAHEQWGELSAGGQRENLARGLAALAELGLSADGMRPPGGALGDAGVEPVRDAGLAYCSPAGSGTGVEAGVAIVPFQWRHVDASCVLPALESVRAGIAGAGDPLEPAAFLAHLEAEVARLRDEGGSASFVLHPFMLDWLGADRLAALLDLVGAAAGSGELWVAPCREVAAAVLAEPRLAEGAELDPTGLGG
jgi:peptidoglycan/xylan/chitin deacetylase (PgdA/CDA1 family)